MRNSKDIRNNKLAINKRKLVVSNRQSKSIGYIVRIVALVIMLIALVYSQNNMVFVNDFTYSSNLLPKAFNGYKIVIISDIHNKTGGILKKVNKQKPDIVLVTGGYVDKDGNYNKSIELINNIGKENVTYYVLGEEDLEYKDSIINGISYAEHLDNYFVTINPTVSSKEEFISKYVDDWIIDEAKKDDEIALLYIGYVLSSLEESLGRTMELGGMDYRENIGTLKNDVFNLFSNDENTIKIMAYSDYHSTNEIAKTTVNMVMTGNIHDKEKVGTVTYNNGTTIFSSNGIGNVDQSRFFNYPNILSITLRDSSIKSKNPLERLLDKIVGLDTEKLLSDDDFKKYIDNISTPE